MAKPCEPSNGCAVVDRRGKGFRDYKGDALPDFLKAKKNENIYIVWALYLTDYHPDFWPHLF